MERGGEINIHPILLAGGTGTRLWPVSRELFPKQLVNLVGDESLIQNTIKRLSPTVDLERLKIVCGKEHLFEIARHLEALGISSEGKIITEPCGRNTAPAILLAILNILKTEEDAVLLVFPSDHVIKDLQGFHERLEAAVRLAEKDYVVTFGIKPDRPETGYGYIEGVGAVEEGALRVKRFVEKPDLETAKDYLSKGNFFWNSGMFAFKASVMLMEFADAEPELLESMRAILSGKGPVSMDSYAALPNISIDYAIMEKTKRGVVLPSDFGWSDIGTWETLYNFLPKDSDDNVVEGDVILKDTRHSFVRGGNRLVVVTGLENVVVIDTPDTVFVSDLEKSKDVKNIVAELKEKGREEYKSHSTVYRPWGTYTILEEMEHTKIKRIVVYPGAKLSLQMHHHRNEHWVVVRGIAKIINGDHAIILKENQSTYVPKENRHRLENPGKEPLHIIEVQMGDYLGEDDIVRFDDDFGRE
ncbi:MAG: mannose-1-phosphate guanylyltransferase/mannose-6-phosphate isomerase [Thermodesulfovibrionia bacterium]|nr:mannose-1-phosphate guanylyltransferase/mannose-6-phosphate isomerase [Thermodesulfovibrionia bacterium]